jgi:hypothetical protein
VGNPAPCEPCPAPNSGGKLLGFSGHVFRLGRCRSGRADALMSPEAPRPGSAHANLHPNRHIFT